MAAASPRTALSKLGRPFEQVQNQFSKNHAGSGLGLAISRSLAELHGGALKIRSTEGVGTIVSVRIPVATQTAESLALKVAASIRLEGTCLRLTQPVLRPPSPSRPVEHAPGPAPRVSSDMRLQHTEIRQVGHRQQQVGQPGRHVVAFERPGQAEPRSSGSAPDKAR